MSNQQDILYDNILRDLRHVFTEEMNLPVDPASVIETTPIYDPEGIVFESMQLLELLLSVEQHFDIEVADHDLDTGILSTVGTLAAYIEQALRRQH